MPAGVDGVRRPTAGRRAAATSACEPRGAVGREVGQRLVDEDAQERGLSRRRTRRAGPGSRPLGRGPPRACPQPRRSAENTTPPIAVTAAAKRITPTTVEIEAAARSADRAVMLRATTPANVRALLLMSAGMAFGRPSHDGVRDGRRRGGDRSGADDRRRRAPTSPYRERHPEVEALGRGLGVGAARVLLVRERRAIGLELVDGRRRRAPTEDLADLACTRPRCRRARTRSRPAAGSRCTCRPPTGRTRRSRSFAASRFWARAASLNALSAACSSVLRVCPCDCRSIMSSKRRNMYDRIVSRPVDEEPARRSERRRARRRRPSLPAPTAECVAADPRTSRSSVAAHLHRRRERRRRWGDRDAATDDRRAREVTLGLLGDGEVGVCGVLAAEGNARPAVATATTVASATAIRSVRLRTGRDCASLSMSGPPLFGQHRSRSDDHKQPGDVCHRAHARGVSDFDVNVAAGAATPSRLGTAEVAVVPAKPQAATKVRAAGPIVDLPVRGPAGRVAQTCATYAATSHACQGSRVLGVCVAPPTPRTYVRSRARAGVVPGLVTGVLPGVVRSGFPARSSAQGVARNCACPSTAHR